MTPTSLIPRHIKRLRQEAEQVPSPILGPLHSPTMFAALNTHPSDTDRRLQEERTRISTLYNSALHTLDIAPLTAYSPRHEENRTFYNRAREYILFNYTSERPMQEVEENIEKYRLTESRDALLCLARRSMEAARFIRARKLLNLARERRYHCNTLYELERTLMRMWRPGAQWPPPSSPQNFSPLE
jgi:hypothetical protein